MVYYLQSKTVAVYGLADYWSVHSCRKVVENTFKVLEFKSQNGITWPIGLFQLFCLWVTA